MFSLCIPTIDRFDDFLSRYLVQYLENEYINEIIITDEAITYIIENNCNNEDGVRNLKRCLEIIYTKLNLYRLMKPGTNLFEQDMTLKVEFPFNVTKNVVDKLIKLKDENQYMKYLYV